MKTIHKWLVLIILLVIAVVCYSIGFGRGAVIFIVAGILFELGFWVGLFKTIPSDHDNNGA